MDIIAQFMYITAFLVLLSRLYKLNLAFWLQFLINLLTTLLTYTHAGRHTDTNLTYTDH